MTVLRFLAATMLAAPAHAQTRKPTAQETLLIHDCVGRKGDGAGEKCIGLVSTRCMKKPGNQAGLNQADCHRIEQEIWDALLNENYKELQGERGAESQGARHAAGLDRIARRDLRILLSQDPGLDVGADDRRVSAQRDRTARAAAGGLRRFVTPSFTSPNWRRQVGRFPGCRRFGAAL
jgi:hypothetical protein